MPSQSRRISSISLPLYPSSDPPSCPDPKGLGGSVPLTLSLWRDQVLEASQLRQLSGLEHRP